MGHITVSISPSKLLFNKPALIKIPDTKKIEILVNPGQRLIAVRKAVSNSRYALEWGRYTEKGFMPKIISGAAFIPTLYKLFTWNIDVQYKINGTAYKFGEDTVLIFSVDDATLSIDKNDFDPDMESDGAYIAEKVTSSRRRRITAYPKEWADSFGEDYYRTKAKEDLITKDRQEKELVSGHVTYSTEEGNVTTPEKAASEIKGILEDLGADE